jgi:hypothetical protein
LPAPLASEAFHVFAGAFLRAAAPHTEADPAGVLPMLLSTPLARSRVPRPDRVVIAWLLVLRVSGWCAAREMDHADAGAQGSGGHRHHQVNGVAQLGTIGEVELQQHY